MISSAAQGADDYSSLAPSEGSSAASTFEFDIDPIGFFHIDLAEVRTAEGKLYLFVAIDRTSKFGERYANHILWMGFWWTILTVWDSTRKKICCGGVVLYRSR